MRAYAILVVAIGLVGRKYECAPHHRGAPRRDLTLTKGRDIPNRNYVSCRVFSFVVSQQKFLHS